MGKYKDSLPGGYNSSRGRRPNGTQGCHTPGGRYGYRTEYLKEQATKHAAARAERSNAEQIAELDRRLGKGIGAAKERARLAE